MIKRFVPFVLASVIAACGGDTLTSPTNPTDSGGGSVVSSAPPPAPAASPSPTPPPPVGDQPYVEFSKDPKNGNVTLFNPTNHPIKFTLEYWDATIFLSQNLLKTITREVKADSSELVVAPILDLECGRKITVQLDIATTFHVGHLFYDYTAPACCVEETVVKREEGPWSAWSETKKGDNGCYQTRTRTITTTTDYTCKEDVVETKVETETRTVECACVEEPKTETKVTYSDWTECTKGTDGKCNQTRTKTTVTTTTYKCSTTPTSSTSVETETRECECKVECVPVWEASEKVSYTPWGACEKQRDGTCAKYREKITEIWHTNSCTKETKLYKTNKEREFSPCECEVEKCELKNYGQQLPTGVSQSVQAPNYNDPEVACAYYGLTGYKLEPVATPWVATADFPVVIIKAGSSSSCDSNENTSWFDVKKGDSLTASLCNNKSISHVIVCECPKED